MVTWLLPMAAASVLAVAFTGQFSAQPGGEQPEPTAQDKMLRKGLLDAMRRGVNLYNEQRDVVGCNRVFEGALYTVKPLLHHHKDLQKKIEDAMANLERQPAGWERAFALRAVLDEVADRLGGKVSGTKDKDGVKDTTLRDKTDKDKTDKDKADKDKPAKTDKDKVTDKDKATTDKKDGAAKDLPVKDSSVKDKKDAPKDEGDKDKQAAADTGTVNGKVTFQGKALGTGVVTFVGADAKTYSADIQPDGTFAVKKALPAGAYKVTVTKSATPAENQQAIEIPSRFTSAETTPLRYTIRRGANTHDVQLGD